MSVHRRTTFDGVSVGIAATENSGNIDVDNLSRVRPIIDTAGADIICKVQTSADGGTTWHDLSSYAAGTTGAQDVIELPGMLIRMSASNGGLLSQVVTAHLLIED